MSHLHWTVILAQATTNNTQSNPLGLLLFLIVFAVGIGGMGFFLVRRSRLRAETRQRAEALGWQYSRAEAWENAPAASFRVLYTYAGETHGIPWVFIHSVKSIQRQTFSAGSSGMGIGSGFKLDNRTDWRTDAVKSPSIVFLQPRPGHARLVRLLGQGVNRVISLILNLGITEGDDKPLTRIGVQFGRLSSSILFNPLGNLPENDYGLRKIESLNDDTFDVYAPDEAIAQQVLNNQARGALEQWKAAFKARFGSRALGYQYRQPFILFHPDGLYMYFTEEEPNVKAVEAIVELGCQLGVSQQSSSGV